MLHLLKGFSPSSKEQNIKENLKIEVLIAELSPKNIDLRAHRNAFNHTDPKHER